MARHATAAQIERIVAAYHRAFDPHRLAEANARERRHHIDCLRDDDGSLIVRAHLEPDDGDYVRGVLDELTERSIRTRPLADGETRAMRRSTALVEMASLAAEAAGGPESAVPTTPADRHLVVVTVDERVLASDEGERCELDGGPGLAAETARRLACDASIVPVVRDAEGRVTGIGRQRRVLPRWLRRMLHARDRGCRFPGCGERRIVLGHHVVHWAHGGATELPNLVELCAFHHRLVHEGGWAVELADDATVTFVRPQDGARFVDRGSSGSAEPADPCAVERGNEQRAVIIEPTTIVPQWSGDRLDLELALTALWSARFRVTGVASPVPA